MKIVQFINKFPLLIIICVMITFGVNIQAQIKPIKKQIAPKKGVVKTTESKKIGTKKAQKDSLLPIIEKKDCSFFIESGNPFSSVQSQQLQDTQMTPPSFIKPPKGGKKCGTNLFLKMDNYLSDLKPIEIYNYYKANAVGYEFGYPAIIPDREDIEYFFTGPDGGKGRIICYKNSNAYSINYVPFQLNNGKTCNCGPR